MSHTPTDTSDPSAAPETETAEECKARIRRILKDYWRRTARVEAEMIARVDEAHAQTYEDDEKSSKS